MMDETVINWTGVAAIALFYLIISTVGIMAAILKTRKSGETNEEMIIVAGRDIGMVVGVFTIIATWVGGGYINGTAEVVFTQGIVWAQAPIGYAISLFVGGILFAKKMRERRYLTMIDPFQERYSHQVGALMYLPALFGELLWSAAVLNALGATVAVIVGINMTYAVIISTCIALSYTMIGGLVSVIYTDVAQLICIAVGLLVALPFAFTSEHVDFTQSKVMASPDNGTYPNWLGTVSDSQIGSYVDGFLLIIFGGIPWQVYFQRVLSARSPSRARMLSILGGVGCLLMSIPPILIGLVAQNVVPSPYTEGHFTVERASMVLPEVLRYLTNGPVMFIGLGAVSAAVMSSCDSSILSASSMFSHNIYKALIRKKACDTEMVWITRLAVLVIASISCFIALSSNSIYTLFALCSDLVYVILFPQLVCVLYLPSSNSYGVLAGSIIGLLTRLSLGEPQLHVPILITLSSNIPVKSICMLLNLMFTISVSWLSHLVLLRMNNLHWDLLNVFNRPNDITEMKKVKGRGTMSNDVVAPVEGNIVRAYASP